MMGAILSCCTIPGTYKYICCVCMCSGDVRVCMYSGVQGRYSCIHNVCIMMSK